MQLCS